MTTYSPDPRIPSEAVEVSCFVRELLTDAVVGVYLFGSAVHGGLRVDSDVDLLVVVNRSLSDTTRSRLLARLLGISGRVDNPDARRPLEVTVLKLDDIVPWRYPPARVFVYGEWLRQAFEQGWMPQAESDPDLALVLAQVRQHGIPVFGPEARRLLAPVPDAHLRRAISDSLPVLVSEIKGDERNVLLTLARMWMTAATGKIVPKDVAADWASERLPKSSHGLLVLARNAYLGKVPDRRDDKAGELEHLVRDMRRSIESCLVE